MEGAELFHPHETTHQQVSSLAWWSCQYGFLRFRRLSGCPTLEFHDVCGSEGTYINAWRLRWQWKIRIFKKSYISKIGCFCIVIWVFFGGCKFQVVFPRFRAQPFTRKFRKVVGFMERTKSMQHESRIMCCWIFLLNFVLVVESCSCSCCWCSSSCCCRRCGRLLYHLFLDG